MARKVNELLKIISNQTVLVIFYTFCFWYLGITVSETLQIWNKADIINAPICNICVHELKILRVWPELYHF
jgi:hypothetical protein